MRLMVTGAAGVLARAVVWEAERRGHHVVALSRQQLDVLDPPAVGEAVRHVRPEVVFHGAAWTDVDGAERAPAAADQLNHLSVRTLVEACDRVGARVVLPSTDFVFDGAPGEVYEGHPVGPANTYGWTKRRGEEVIEGSPFHLIVRTQALVPKEGRHFAAAILDRARRGQAVRVVHDRWASLTWVPALAGAILDLVDARWTGLVHLAGQGACTWYEYATAVFEGAGVQAPIEAVPASVFGAAAPRPERVLLRSQRPAPPLPHWEDCVRHVVQRARETVG